MEVWMWILLGLMVILLIFLLIKIFKRNGEEDIFESAGNRIKKLGACCSKLFKGR